MYKQHIKAELVAKNRNNQTPPNISNKYPPTKLPIDSPVKNKYIKLLIINQFKNKYYSNILKVSSTIY